MYDNKLEDRNNYMKNFKIVFNMKKMNNKSKY